MDDEASPGLIMGGTIADSIQEYGWAAVDVCDGQPPFTYTVGLMTKSDHPELIIFGLETAIRHRILASIVRPIQSGASYREAGSYAVRDGLSDESMLGLRCVHPTQHQLYLGYAMGNLREAGRMGDLQAMQIFWPDRSGKFPYEAGCDFEAYRCQPRLDIPLTPSEIEEFEREWGS